MRDGALVQVGTPEELVGAPADEYVANFTRDFPKSHVLTLKWIARAPRDGEDLTGPTLASSIVVRDAARQVLEAGRPVRVMDGGELVGVITVDEILSVIAGVTD